MLFSGASTIGSKAVYLSNPKWEAIFMKLTAEEKQILDQGFRKAFGYEPVRYFSAPGRTEIGGNHTDHQGGRVLAAAVDLDTRAAVASNGSSTIRVLSEGYPLCRVDLSDLTPRSDEINTTAALIRGVAAGMAGAGCPVTGFDAYVMSTVLPGSGLSSSAAFEVLMGTILNCLFHNEVASPESIAKIGQFAENTFFGKPCGLMDQMASAVGGLVAMDFGSGMVRPLNCDLSQWDHALCIIDTHASHAELTGEYAAVPAEMKAVAAYFDCEILSQVPAERFYEAIPGLRSQCGDRAVLRALHYYEENRRVEAQWAALEQGDFPAFLELVKASGRSSFQYLQNIVVSSSTVHQEMALALALCEKFLGGRGACRVHGGGFAGTIQAFVPKDLLEAFCMGMDGILGPESCHVLSIRPYGGIELEVEE